MSELTDRQTTTNNNPRDFYFFCGQITTLLKRLLMNKSSVSFRQVSIIVSENKNDPCKFIPLRLFCFSLFGVRPIPQVFLYMRFAMSMGDGLVRGIDLACQLGSLIRLYALQ